jgi:hypothetical protein
LSLGLISSGQLMDTTNYQNGDSRSMVVLMLILGISSGCILVYLIVRHNQFFDNTLQYVYLLDSSQRLFGLTVEKRLYFVQKFILHLLVRYRKTLTSKLGIAGFTEQVLGINGLSLGGHSLKNLNYIAGEYVYHMIYSYKLTELQEYFQSLTESGQFEKGNLGDRIAMLAVYMPIVRDATHAYVELWNHHRIRKQPNRPNAVSGFPYLLYHYPPSGVGSYEVPISQEYISQLEESLEEWGM